MPDRPPLRERFRGAPGGGCGRRRHQDRDRLLGGRSPAGQLGVARALVPTAYRIATRPVVFGLTALLTGPIGALPGTDLHAAAQTPGNTVVIHGRVEDAATREPIEGVLLITADSTMGVYSDSLGAFAIPMPPEPPYVLHADQIGYALTTFELAEGAPERLSILVLDPEPVPVEGLTVIEESAVTALLGRMDLRRSAYVGRISVYDRTRLLESGADSAYDLVRRRSLLFECPNLPGELCRDVRGRVGSLLVCIDEQRAAFPISDLQALSIDSVVMAELYGPTIGFGASVGLGTFAPSSPVSTARGYEAGQVRVYTRQWMTSSAGRRGRALYPAIFGC